ncbi:unnamed protein product, partial [marine sediment metagenome]
MVNKPLAAKLFRDLWMRRGTLLALILVIAVGIANYIGMAAVYRDLDSARTNYYNKYNLADFTIDIKRASEAAVNTIPYIPNVLHLRKRIRTDVMMRVPGAENRLIPGIAVSLPVPRRDIINNVKLINGAWFTDPYAKEVILDEQFAKARDLNIGDRVKVRLPNKEYEMLVVGTAISPEFAVLLAPGSMIPDPAHFTAIYMPYKFLQEATNLAGSFNQLLGLTRDSSTTALKNTMTLISDKLDNYG